LDIDAIKIILNEYMEDMPFQMDWDRLKDIYYRKFIKDKFKYHIPIAVEEQVEMMRMIDSIVNYTQYCIEKKGMTNDLTAILQWNRNVNANYSYATLFEQDIEYYQDIEKTKYQFKIRDLQIAEIVLWITEHFPNLYNQLLEK
jgi:hypothetical protein